MPEMSDFYYLGKIRLRRHVETRTLPQLHLTGEACSDQQVLTGAHHEIYTFVTEWNYTECKDDHYIPRPGF